MKRLISLLLVLAMLLLFAACGQTGKPEETTPVTTAAPEETVPVAPNPGNPGNTALIVGICMMVAALVIVAVVFLRKKK